MMLKVAAAMAMTVTVTSLMSAPIAGADADSDFLDEITTDHAGLPGKTPAENVAAGRAACNRLEHGTSVLDEMNAVGTLFVSAATTNLCPDFASQHPKGQGNGSDSCVSGYHWRQANPADHVCVTEQARNRTAQENAEAAGRVDPNGAYGPNSCKQGYVWRNAYNGDAVCVTPNIRDIVATENAEAASKVAH